MRPDAKIAAALVMCAAAACSDGDYDPLERARASAEVDNLEASIPPACYAESRRSNTCWACHTIGQGTNLKTDLELQAHYDFSATARTNAWRNLFVDRSAE